MGTAEDGGEMITSTATAFIAKECAIVIFIVVVPVSGRDHKTIIVPLHQSIHPIEKMLKISGNISAYL